MKFLLKVVAKHHNEIAVAELKIEDLVGGLPFHLKKTALFLVLWIILKKKNSTRSLQISCFPSKEWHEHVMSKLATTVPKMLLPGQETEWLGMFDPI